MDPGWSTKGTSTKWRGLRANTRVSLDTTCSVCGTENCARPGEAQAPAAVVLRYTVLRSSGSGTDTRLGRVWRCDAHQLNSAGDAGGGRPCCLGLVSSVSVPSPLPWNSGSAPRSAHCCPRVEGTLGLLLLFELKLKLKLQLQLQLQL